MTPKQLEDEMKAAKDRFIRDLYDIIGEIIQRNGHIGLGEVGWLVEYLVEGDRMIDQLDRPGWRLFDGFDLLRAEKQRDASPHWNKTEP